MELRSFEWRSSASRQNREHFYVRVENATKLRSTHRTKGEHVHLEARDVQRRRSEKDGKNYNASEDGDRQRTTRTGRLLQECDESTILRTFVFFFGKTAHCITL